MFNLVNPVLPRIEVSAGRIWCHLVYIGLTAAGLSGLHALKFWLVFWHLGFKRLKVVITNRMLLLHPQSHLGLFTACLSTHY